MRKKSILLFLLLTFLINNIVYSDMLEPENYNLKDVILRSNVVGSRTPRTMFKEYDYGFIKPEKIEPEKVVLNFTGDVCFGTPFGESHPSHSTYSKYGAGYFLSGVKEIFENDNFTILNVENVFTDSKEAIKGKIWAYKSNLKYIDILDNNSVEVATVANNHMQDFKQKGLDDTVKALESKGIKVVGFNDIIGNDPELGGVLIDKKTILEHDGIKIGLLSYLAFIPTVRVSEKKFKSDVAELKKQGAEYIVVTAHWGGQYTKNLTANQKRTGPQYIDWGADLVVGNHPHVLQSMEIYKGKRIYYSLGNLMFTHSNSSSDRDTVILNLTLERNSEGKLVEKFKHIPISWTGSSSSNSYKPIPFKGVEAQSRIAKTLGVSLSEVELIK